MTTIRKFCCNDFLRLSTVNLERFTITHGVEGYRHFLAWWPQYFLVAEAPGNRIMGFVMGQTQEFDYPHGHINEMAFASEYRSKQFVKNLMNHLEDIFDYTDAAYFVDFHVSTSKSSTIKMFEEFDYVIYRRRERYFRGTEDALNMRKALSRDTTKKSLIPFRDKNSRAPPGELYTAIDENEADKDEF
ncbi:N-terminal acetyltransferase B complex catalytic subunit NAA20-like [Cornus florida]|uniref:N-terminal acetyltransferase B complex catalytic subunit NAA20-like n=1 Tax=Cornus florida TaxID=4283 RepID=UPI0028A10966|nr:N-terminal acetyltransferase B complex catalytic subunit NAA20-like [Cornus florida]